MIIVYDLDRYILAIMIVIKKKKKEEEKKERKRKPTNQYLTKQKPMRWQMAGLPA